MLKAVYHRLLISTLKPGFHPNATHATQAIAFAWKPGFTHRMHRYVTPVTETTEYTNCPKYSNAELIVHDITNRGEPSFFGKK